jgi:hypothetical protein
MAIMARKPILMPLNATFTLVKETSHPYNPPTFSLLSSSLPFYGN